MTCGKVVKCKGLMQLRKITRRYLRNCRKIKKTTTNKRIYTRKLNWKISLNEGIDFYETFTLIVRYESIRIFLAIAAGNNLELA
ncbi:putative mitochondrial protein-like [Vespula squamosa]|uniref:Mitochondrial protein-like n=1 Tax=Vespula squamosa TaxID=30214 RepID=A0ABD2A189_VESSQ